MGTLFLIVIALFLVSVIFTVWNHILIKRHLNRLRRGHTHFSAITDERYYELKSRQDYIISCAIFIIAGLTLLGYNSITDFKKEISADFDQKKKEIDIIVLQAKLAGDLANEAATNVAKAKSEISVSKVEADKIIKDLALIKSKNIIQSNIYIVSQLRFKDFPMDKENYRLVQYSKLRTINGEPLPTFKKPPSIIATSSTGASFTIKDPTITSFKISTFAYLYVDKGYTPEEVDRMDFIDFDLWITEVP